MTSILPHWLRPSLLFFLYIFAIPPGWLGRIRKPVHSKALNTFNFKNFIHIQLINSTFTVQIPNCNPWILMKPSLSLSISSKFNQLLSNEAFSQLLCSIIQVSVRSWATAKQLNKKKIKRFTCSHTACISLLLRSTTETESSTEQNKHANPQTNEHTSTMF